MLDQVEYRKLHLLAGARTGECLNYAQVGHNKADCTNERVERPFEGIRKP